MSTFIQILNPSLGSIPLMLLKSSADVNWEESSLIKYLASKSSSTQLENVYLPSMLYVHDQGQWRAQTDSSIISRKKYLYISYSRSEFSDRDKLNLIAQDACEALDLDAYWIDYACIGNHTDGRMENIRRMGDIIKGAFKTLVLVGPWNDSQRSEEWLRWRSRLWTIPELILSRELVKLSGVEGYGIDRRVICKKIFRWEVQDLDTKVVCYHLGGYKLSTTQFSPDALEGALIDVIWNKGREYETLTDLRVERVYALMSLLIHKIEPMTDETEAFRELMIKNHLTNYCSIRPGKEGGMPISGKEFENFSVPIQFFFDPPGYFYPSRLILYRDSRKWVHKLSIDIPKQNFLAFSYRQNQINDLISLEARVRYSSRFFFDCDAYWLDMSCMSNTGPSACMDLYQMADVYLRAKMTIIILPDSTEEKSVWSQWGQNVWSLMEVLLSSELCYRIGDEPYKRITKKEILTNAYGAESAEMKVLDIAESTVTGGPDSQRTREVWAHIMNAIWRRTDTNTGKILVSNSLGGEKGSLKLTEFKAERVYALMMFMPVRIFPEVNETEYDALKRLLRANKIGGDFISWLSRWCSITVPEQKHLSHFFESSTH